jgi:arginase
MTAGAAGRLPRLIAVPCGLGARDRRCGAGPQALLSGGLLERLAQRGITVERGATVAPWSAGSASVFQVIGDLCNRLAREVRATLLAGEFPLVLGGDHSCAVGTWTGAAAALAARGPLGLVWIDAHMDSHTPVTSHSGMPHGMPLAALLGRGANPKVAREVAALAHEGSFKPGNVCLVGVRSFEPEEAAFIEEVGIHLFPMQDVERRGIGTVLADAVRIASTGTAGYGVSLDIDVVDPGEAPGVGTPEPGGVPGAQLVEALRQIAGDPRLLALEIVEYNPDLDPAGKTAALVEELLAAALAR